MKADLLESAKSARQHAYSPYSEFPVAAALLDSEGRVHIGVNVENASYGLSICAERVAVARAIADGARSFRAIAIMGPQDDQPCLPCGSCRQVLHEFSPDLLVIVPQAGGELKTIPLSDLLPDAFDPERLGGRPTSST